MFQNKLKAQFSLYIRIAYCAWSRSVCLFLHCLQPF